MTNQSINHRPHVLTGLRANSNLTIANYLGAMLPMANLTKKHKDTHDFYMFVPDLHSFTTPINHDELHKNTLQNVAFYVAAGAIDLESDNVRVHRQSYVPHHSELTWILDCFTHMGELSRMTQFKDKSGHAQNESVSVGLFNYPVLMAADILLYGASYIPLGDDQKQHLELTRDLAMRINERFKDVFPEGVFETVPVDWKSQLNFSGLDQGVRIRSLRNPTKKMSKSDEDTAGFITLADDPRTAAKKIMAATTDSEGMITFDWRTQPGISNLLQIIALLQKRPLQKVVAEWEGKTQYGELKMAAAKQVGDFLESFQTALVKIDHNALLTKIEADEVVARKIAGEQLLRVQQAVGLRPRA